jgi:hypothetical protein
MNHGENKTERTSPSRGSWAWLRTVLPVSFALALTLTFGTADAWAKTNVAPPAEPAAEIVPLTPAPASAGDIAIDPAFEDYAQREAMALGLEGFQGGDVVIIGSGGLVLILIIIILILAL